MAVESTWKFGKAFKGLAEKQLGEGYQSKLAALLGVKPSAVNQFLNGAHPMSEKTISAIATALGIDYLELTQMAMRRARARQGKAAPAAPGPRTPVVKVAAKGIRQGKAPSSDIPKAKKTPAKKSAKAAA